MKNKKIKDLIDGFIKHIRMKGYSEQTVNKYSNELLHIFTILEKRIIKKTKYKIEQIQPIDIENLNKFFAFDAKKPNSPFAISRKMSCLNSFFNYLERFDLIDKNIMKKIERPKLPKIVYFTPSDEVMERFFKHLEERKYRNEFEELTYLLFFYLKYASMARTHEMTKIKVKDIDFDKRILLLHGKGNKDRIVPITKKSISLAKKFIKIAGLDKEDFLIRDKDNRPITTRGLEMREKSLLVEADIPKEYTLHVLLRKKPATKLYEATKDLVLVQNILGHASPKTTRKYVNPSMDEYLERFKEDHPLEI